MNINDLKKEAVHHVHIEWSAQQRAAFRAQAALKILCHYRVGSEEAVELADTLLHALEKPHHGN